LNFPGLTTNLAICTVPAISDNESGSSLLSKVPVPANELEFKFGT